MGCTLRRILIITTALLAVIVFSYPSLPDSNGVFTAPLQLSSSVYYGIGSPFDVYEFARNQSQLFLNARNDTSFTYPAAWFPSTYRGYRLHAEVQNLRKVVNPVKNGDFESYAEVGNNWTLSHDILHTVASATTVTGGNPGSCLDVELINKKELGTRASYVDNDFNYTSVFTPDILSVSFDIRFSNDITQAYYLQVSVLVLDEIGSPKGLWIESTSSFHPTSWTTQSFSTLFVNGSTTLRVAIEKIDPSNLNVYGHVFFDNFRYEIGSYAPPGEVDLTLNDTDVVDTIGSNGEVDIYADNLLQEEILYEDAWNETLLFAFNATAEITFDYSYSVYVKSVNLESASTQFSAEINLDPTWIINYSIPSDRPPPGYQGYQFGIYLEQGWTLDVVRDDIGNLVSNYFFNPTTRFFLLESGIATPGESFSIYSSSQNFVSEIYFQKSSTGLGLWTNVSGDEYFVIGDYLRILSVLEDTSAAGYTAEISTLFPNGTVCHQDTSPILNTSSNTLTSHEWQVEPTCELQVGLSSVAMVSYNSSSQCGFRSQTFTIMNRAQGILNSPLNGSALDWGGVIINVSWHNRATENFITDGRAVLRYTDEFSQIQFAEMASNGYGSYSIRISTLNYDPVSSLDFDVEFYRRGYVNATIGSGTSLYFTVTVNNGIPPTFMGIDTRILLISALVLIIVVTTFLAVRIYRRQVIIPRQVAHEKKLQAALDMFNDVTNLSRVLVLHKSSGIPIFDPFKGRGIDASIFGGFLSAIQAFAIDVANGSSDQALKESTHLSEISYEGFRIIINDGLAIRTALIYKGTPSEALKERINQFTHMFEDKYREDLARYGNQPEKFSGAVVFLEDIFQVSLLFPHSVEPKTKDVSLSVQESRLHFIALELTRERQTVYLSEIVNKYLETIQENPVELLNAILLLREKNLLIPSEGLLRENSNSE